MTLTAQRKHDSACQRVRFVVVWKWRRHRTEPLGIENEITSSPRRAPPLPDDDHVARRSPFAHQYYLILRFHSTRLATKRVRYISSKDSPIHDSTRANAALLAMSSPITITPSTSHITVQLNGNEVADTRRALLLKQTGLRARYYIPRADVKEDMLRESSTSSFCPYKVCLSSRSH